MKLPIIRLLWLLSAAAASAATHAVLPGEAIQPKIDAAAPGDIIAIFGGTYPGDVTINKAVRLVEVDGQDVTITGNVTWSGVTNAPPFEGFVVGSSGKGITVTNTTGLTIKNVNSQAGFGVNVNGSSCVGVTNCSVSNIAQDGGELVVTSSQIYGSFETTIICEKTVAFRTNVSVDVRWNSKKAWFGYSTGRLFVFSNSNSRVFIIGSKFDRKNILWNHGDGVDVPAGINLRGINNYFLVANSSVLGVAYRNRTNWSTVQGYGIQVYSGNRAQIINNYIHLFTDWDDGFNDYGHCVYSVGPDSEIINNILIAGQTGVRAPYGAIAKNNCHYGYTCYHEYGGVVSFGKVTVDPLFVANQAPKLQSSSPCINAGVNDPIFNDLDGSRNDIGPSGGCLFDPQGWTTNKPVVISFDLAPQQLLKGVDTQVNLSNGEAVAQP